MMIKLTQLMLGLVTAITVAVAGARLAGGASQPLSYFADTFMTNPDGSLCAQPCLFGVRPGLTGYAEVSHIVSAHPIRRFLSQPIIRLRSSWAGNGFTFTVNNFDVNLKQTDLAMSLYVYFTTQPRQGQRDTD